MKLNYRNIVLLLLVLLVFLFITGVVSPVSLFDTILIRPMLNFLVLLAGYLFGSFGLAIVILTVIVRVITFPLTIKQLRSTRAMQELQPKLKEVQKKYAKDKERLGQETMKLYKEQGVNPLGCAVPMLFQFPIWIGLYQAVIQGLGFSPENLMGLSKQLYSLSAIQEQVPLNSHFLWLDLGSGDIFMAILVAASMWALQKMSQLQTADASQQQMSRMMLWIMPLMFGFMALTFPSGLSLYWVLTNLISMVIQYRVTGWGGLRAPSIATITGGPQKWFGAGGGTVISGAGKKGEEISPDKAKGTWDDSSTVEGEGEAGSDLATQRKRVRHGKHRDKRQIRRRSR
ncbi:MAG: YidC/Oxa1 family membrane protein insertase [Dehalococcoidia bacterium]|nr:YidC/Oxa1 family membrane protein insertase [Dehalococcoidia bacterium]